MRGADTNTLVRYLINDNLKQAEAVEQLIEECKLNREPVFIPILVLCELVWVLDRALGKPRAKSL